MPSSVAMSWMVSDDSRELRSTLPTLCRIASRRWLFKPGAPFHRTVFLRRRTAGTLLVLADDAAFRAIEVPP
jgi:hypothetical protein